MKVLKFGGTSVEDADAMGNVIGIVRRSLSDRLLVVVSACAGVTNALLGIAKKAVLNSQEEALQELDALIRRHKQIADTLLKAGNAETKKIFDLHSEALTGLVKSLAVLKVLPPQTLDQCVSYGEQWSSLLLASAMKEAGISAVKIDAVGVMITDDQFTQAVPQFDMIERRAKEKFLPPMETGMVVVTQGFLGSNKDGVTTTIGRGGSDYSAAIFGAVMGAAEIQIWTDVDGVLSADPNIIPTARRIRELSFNEAAELAYFGAKVLHPSTILPAIEKNIPVRVLNSRRPQYEGTLITNHPGASNDCVVKSVAYRRGITVITIQSTRMLMGYGFLARVFDIFSRHQKSVDVVVTSEVSVSLTIDEASHLDQIVRELELFSTVRVESQKAILCLVGENMKYTKGIAGRIFNALGREGINIEMISHGGSEINLTFVISESQIVSAVQALHAELFPA